MLAARLPSQPITAWFAPEFAFYWFTISQLPDYPRPAEMDELGMAGYYGFLAGLPLAGPDNIHNHDDAGYFSSWQWWLDLLFNSTLSSTA